MSCRVLFACWPFEGHVFPQLSMALALRERGAEVAFYTGDSMREVIEAQGFEVFAFQRVGPAWQRVHEGAVGGGGGRRASVALLRQAREWIVGTIPDQIADVNELVARWHPDVLAVEASMWGPLLVLSDLLTIPVALVSPLIGAGVPGPDAPVPGGLAPRGSARAHWLQAAAGRATALVTRRMRRRLDAIRAERGLGAMGCSVNEFFGRLPLYLVLNVPELDYRRRDLPPSIHYVGPCLWHPREPQRSDDWLEAIPSERPWVHVTEGTSHFQEPFLLRAAAEGLAGAGCEAILTTGRARRPDQLGLGPAAANVHVASWLSHDTLLARCAAVVTTGGMGTVMAALAAGVPLVVVPTTWDKPANARRVADAGVGVRLSPRRCTPARLRAAVDGVLVDPGYRARAQASAAWLGAAPGPAGAARLIEGLAAERPRGEPVGRAERLLG